MADKPISEIIFTLLYGFAVYALSQAIYTSIDGFVGWGDLIAVIVIFYQLGASILSIPFLRISLKRLGAVGWFRLLVTILLGMYCLRLLFYWYCYGLIRLVSGSFMYWY